MGGGGVTCLAPLVCLTFARRAAERRAQGDVGAGREACARKGAWRRQMKAVGFLGTDIWGWRPGEAHLRDAQLAAVFLKLGVSTRGKRNIAMFGV